MRKFKKNQVVNGPAGLGIVQKRLKGPSDDDTRYFVGLGMCGIWAHWSKIRPLTKKQIG
jgi:hypothetical protein